MVQSDCTRLEITRDVLAMEENALLELTECIEKICTALQAYLDLTDDVSLTAIIRIGFVILLIRPQCVSGV